MMDWAAAISMDMIPEQYRELAGIVGVPQLLELAEQHGGTCMYIPKTEALIRAERDRRIKEEYNGYNTDALAKKYDLTPRWVDMICRNEPLPGQLTIWDADAAWDADTG